MDAETKKDLFASVINFCEPTASREAKLPNCPLAREPEKFVDSCTSSPDLTPSYTSGIVMISPPGSSGLVHQHTVEEDAVFHTPPEHHSHSHLSSSEDQNPNEWCAEGLKISEAGDGSDKTTKVRVSDDEPESKRARVALGEEFDGETVPLGETQVVQDTEAIASDHDDSGGEERATSNYDSGGEERTTSNLAEGSLDVTVQEIGGLMKDSVAKFDGNHECVGERYNVVELRSGVGGCENVAEISKDSNMPNDSHGDGGLRINGERVKEIEEFRYAGRPVGVGGSGKMHQLPPSLKEVVETSEKKNGLLDFLNVLKAGFGDTEDDCEDVDFLETAKRSGWEFPRPRWWPSDDEW